MTTTTLRAGTYAISNESTTGTPSVRLVAEFATEDAAILWFNRVGEGSDVLVLMDLADDESVVIGDAVKIDEDYVATLAS